MYLCVLQIKPWLIQFIPNDLLHTTQCLISRVDKLFVEWNEIHNLVTKQSFWEGGEYFHCPIGIITRWIIPNLVIIRRFIIAKILRTNASSNGGRRITLRPLQLAKRGYLDRLRPLAKLERGGKTFPNDTWTKTFFCVKWQKWVSRDAAPGYKPFFVADFCQVYMRHPSLGWHRARWDVLNRSKSSHRGAFSLNRLPHE